MTRVFLNYVPKKQSVLKEGILESMKFYGKVCEIKKMMNGNFFEGQVSILLDTNDDGVDKKYRPLQRMLYMAHWDRYIPATFKGAPPVCYQCRQAGHIRKECPVMKQITCSRCLEKGHTAKFCQMNKEDFNMALEQYEQYEQIKQKQELQQKEQMISTEENSTPSSPNDKIQNAMSTPLPVASSSERSTSSSHNSVSEDERMELDNQKEVSHEEKRDTVVLGIQGSKYAPITTRTTMDVDPEESSSIDNKKGRVINSTKEMMALSSSKTYRRLAPQTTTVSTTTIVPLSSTASQRKSRLNTLTTSSPRK
ncbi:uncharacterized protein BX664DRAFT_351204 [Halteromyces radiatus]|uniref:uncharacterized protein n=1 Tax=Halteromyces radiatus TaxID=101107 RepID=UPI00221EBB53|nr:uncharacterized protein BX664DRAFT_351204 [Halteromyces radiatus]KAI8086804.1 hypothetical protein BX664DRAFT_351204 [Halteromyces radiatus]